MKIEPIKTQPTFQPVEVKFVFETQEELDVVSSLFNHALVANTANQITGKEDFSDCIRDSLWKIGGKEIHAQIVKCFDENASFIINK